MIVIVIVIDTDVVSEMMRGQPDRTVLAWPDAVGRLHTTAITLADIDYGIARLPDGRRRDQLARTAAEVFADFGDVVLAFDARAPAGTGRSSLAGRGPAAPSRPADAQIAAICASRQSTLATRSTGDFDETGIRLINPWDCPDS